MELIDNKTKTLKEDVLAELKKGSKLSVAAACFSIYAFQELKEQLEDIDQLRFIFTSKAFLSEKANKEEREFYIPRLDREKSLYGTEFEIKLRNKLTQKAIARECAQWIKEKVKFKANVTDENMAGFINLDEKSYTQINGFTTVDLGCQKGNNAYNIVNKIDAPYSNTYLELFEELWNDSEKLEDVTEEVLENIKVAYKENSPDFIYFVALYNIFNEFLEDVSEDNIPIEYAGFKDSKIWNTLYNFQKDAALGIIKKLEKYNGCILADSVGLGKTFISLAVIKYYEARNKTVLVLCPKKLSSSWDTYRDNYVNNPLAEDKLNYKVLYHTDLNRDSGISNGTDLSRLKWDAYDLVVIDESHNFRNGGRVCDDLEGNEEENRYEALLEKVIRPGIQTKVLMLSASPVNNKFVDLKNQLALAYEGNNDNINEKLNTTNTIDDIFENAHKAFTTWSKYSLEERTTENLLNMLDFDFFEILDSVTIARSRKHIKKYYDTSAIGSFPTRLKPISLRPQLTDLEDAIDYDEIYRQLMQLALTIYAPAHFILPEKREKYAELFNFRQVKAGITHAEREQRVRRLAAINLMKRLESSVNSFNLTLKGIKDLIDETIASIEAYDSKSQDSIELTDISNIEEYDGEDQNTDEIFSFGKKVKIEIGDMDYKNWKDTLYEDSRILETLISLVGDITPEYDCKLKKLIDVIENKIENPINEGNRKIIVFTAFDDTAQYLYDNVSTLIKEKYNLNTALISGTVEAKSTAEGLENNLNTVLTCFSPISKDKALTMPDDKTDVDIIIATDCISEGHNLQDCDYLINYDIHWNPVRIVQRFGRVDRIGSRNKYIQLVNFWPNITLDDYINLKAKVENRMKILDMTATGDDNLLSNGEKADLEYRKVQLQNLQEDIVDLDEMTTGISIMDLGLNEFRLDLLEYAKNYHEKFQAPDQLPYGLHAVVRGNEEMPAGAIYVLKNNTANINSDNKNRLHPFYMVYMAENGDVVCDHFSTKAMLDIIKKLCKGKREPDNELCQAFNMETEDGKNMSEYSGLLEKAIKSISSEAKDIDDFQLVCMLIVR